MVRYSAYPGLHPGGNTYYLTLEIFNGGTRSDWVQLRRAGSGEKLTRLLTDENLGSIKSDTSADFLTVPDILSEDI